MAEEQTRRCSHCDESISIKAKRCPKCQTDLRSWINRHPILTIFLILLGFSSVIIGLTILGRHVEQTQKQQEEARAKGQWLQTAGQRYYDAQKAYYDKLGKALSISPDKLNVVTDVEIAKKTMTNCLNKLDRQHCEDVINGVIWIGEPKEWLTLTMGNYTSSRNTTTVNGLIREQWVYGDPIYGATYVYFDNDKVSSWQLSEH